MHIDLPQPQPQPGTQIPDAIIDHAEKIGQAVARIDALEASHAALQSAHDALSGSIDGLRSSVDGAYEVAHRAVAATDGIGETIAREVAAQLEAAEHVVTPEVEPVQPAPRVENPAPEQPHGWRGFVRRLNIH